MPFGHIYLITHLASGRYYVGQTITAPKQRWNCHRHDARYRSICPIDRAIGKHGEGQFVFEVLASADSKEQLDGLEKLWILVTASTERGIGFNVRSGGGIGSLHSEETKAKLRAARLAQVIDPDSYKRGADKRRGRKQSLEHTEAIRKALKGRTMTPEWRAKMSESAKRRCATPEWKERLQRINSDPANQERNREHLRRLNQARKAERDARLCN